MRRWNGWGDDSNNFPLKKSAHQFLIEALGEGNILKDATFDDVLAQVPDSRMPEREVVPAQPAAWSLVCRKAWDGLFSRLRSDR